MITDDAAEAILDLRESCVKQKKALMYIVVDDNNPNKGIQIATPRSAKEQRNDIDDTIRKLLKLIKFDKELVGEEKHVIWELIIKNPGVHRVYRFNLKGSDPNDSCHLEITTVKMSDLVKPPKEDEKV